MSNKTNNNSSSNGNRGNSYRGANRGSSYRSGELSHSAVHKPVPGKGGKGGTGK